MYSNTNGNVIGQIYCHFEFLDFEKKKKMLMSFWKSYIWT